MPDPIPPFLAAALRKTVLTPQHHLIDRNASFADLDIDALDRLTLCCEIEEELGVEIGDPEMEAWDSVEDLLASVKSRATEPLAGQVRS